MGPRRMRRGPFFVSNDQTGVKVIATPFMQ